MLKVKLRIATVLGILGRSLVVSCCATANAIDNGHDPKHTAVKNGETSPFLPYVSQHSSFTRIATVAQRPLLVAPFLAIAALRHRWP